MKLSEHPQGPAIIAALAANGHPDAGEAPIVHDKWIDIGLMYLVGQVAFMHERTGRIESVFVCPIEVAKDVLDQILERTGRPIVIPAGAIIKAPVEVGEVIEAPAREPTFVERLTTMYNMGAARAAALSKTMATEGPAFEVPVSDEFMRAAGIDPTHRKCYACDAPCFAREGSEGPPLCPKCRAGGEDGGA